MIKNIAIWLFNFAIVFMFIKIVSFYCALFNAFTPFGKIIMTIICGYSFGYNLILTKNLMDGEE